MGWRGYHGTGVDEEGERVTGEVIGEEDGELRGAR
jgi:hypothetical protein